MMIDSPKFVHVDVHRYDQLLADKLLVGGYYNWHRAFGGELLLRREVGHRLADFDIIFVAMTGYTVMARLVSWIRDTVGDQVKIVSCVDYAWQGWGQPFDTRMHSLRAELLQVDLVFAAEPMMVPYLKALLGHNDVKLLLHPVDTKALNSRLRPLTGRDKEVVTVVHKYDNDFITPWLATKNLQWPVHVVAMDANLKPTLPPYFELVVDRQPFNQYTRWLSGKRVLLDAANHINTYGRLQVECACFGLPVVGARNVWSQNILWPELTTTSADAIAQGQLIDRLMEDDDFYVRVADQAWETVTSEYSYEVCKDKMLRLLTGEIEHEIETECRQAVVS